MNQKTQGSARALSDILNVSDIEIVTLRGTLWRSESHTCHIWPA